MEDSKHHTSDIESLVEGLSDRARSLWAKSDFADPTNWMPLFQHIADSAMTACHLWDTFLPQAVRGIVVSEFGGDEVLARKVAVWLAAAHDLGKASPAFACQSPGLREQVQDSGLPFTARAIDNRRSLPHSQASYAILVNWLESQGVPRRTASFYAAVPLGHHGRFAAHTQTKLPAGYPPLGDTERWQPVQLEFAAYAARLADIGPDDLVRLGGIRPRQVVMIPMTALVILSDWIASNPSVFPVQSHLRPRGEAGHALTRLALPRPWSPKEATDTEILGEHLGISDPRPVQGQLLTLARTVEEPELIIVEAPTGEGKTAAALAAAEVLANRFGLGGVVFALPTQATSDAMFGTIKRWLKAVVAADDVSVVLAHGNAEFNDEYTAMPRLSPVYDEGEETASAACDECETGRAIAHWWLTGRGKLATMSDFVVCTIDQVLLGALESKHVVLRHLGLAGKVIVLDEVHAADVYMRQYLKRMLTGHNANHEPVIAMSATLSPSIRHELATTNNDCPTRNTPHLDGADLAYPRLTCTAEGGTASYELPASSRSSTFVIEERHGDLADIAAQVIADVGDGGHAAVVCDTVSRAQLMYDELVDRRPDGVEVVLLHSRFLTPDRLTRERMLRARLGPKAQRDPAVKLIVVATQVIEQSLDIDFDVMYTDVAPIDLILQRAGRLHRHGWKDEDRPHGLRQARLTLMGLRRDELGVPTFDKGMCSVYGEAYLLAAVATLDEHRSTTDSVASPQDVARLVTRAYETISPPPGWDSAWERAQTAQDTADVRRAVAAKQFQIPPPRPESLVRWATKGIDDTAGERGVAQVRDSDESIEVVIIQRIDGRLVVPKWSAEYPSESVENGTVIDDDLARVVARNVVRLPGYLGLGQQGGNLIAELEDNYMPTWQNSTWLRGVLPMILDNHGATTCAGHVFRYDIDRGLLVERQGKN